MNRVCKRLIEVDLPIGVISQNAAAEMEKRRGHIPMMHIWWAHRPPVACRSILLAGLLPDPADPACPKTFHSIAKCVLEEYWNHFGGKHLDFHDCMNLREGLLRVVSDISNYALRCDSFLMDTATKLVAAAYPSYPPCLLDSFSGGGIIPFEGVRLQINTIASDLNPCAVLINKVVLEYMPRYAGILTKETERWAKELHLRLRKKLAHFYPPQSNDETPVAYIWARVVTCEGPNCGIEIPLIKQMWLARKGKTKVAMEFEVPADKSVVHIKIIENAQPNNLNPGTYKGGAATCPVCGYTTHSNSVKKQLRTCRGGTQSARMLVVVCTRKGIRGRYYRLPTKGDLDAITAAKKFLKQNPDNLDLPREPLPSKDRHRAVGSQLPLYGFETFSDLFAIRQLLVLGTLSKMIHEIFIEIAETLNEEGLAKAIVANLALLLDKMADMNTSLCVWQTHAGIPAHLFGRKAFPMVTDFAEAVPVGESSGTLISGLKRTLTVLREYSSLRLKSATVLNSNASSLPLPDNLCAIYFSDPPYYDSVPYADLSDFFYVWLRRSIGDIFPDLFQGVLTEKNAEATVNHPNSEEEKLRYVEMLTNSWAEALRVLRPDGIAVIIFAHKSTAGWEALLESILSAGWCITASWPIDTEMKSRMNAKNTASLSSSVHLVCRPRENLDGSLRTDDVGDWRDVLTELPKRIHEWMPRLAKEGVVGADAIFSCLGPALEIYSRYSSVEKASGEKVELKEYLEEVWAAVSREALNMIFEGADASGFEEDARLTAMWLWTLRTAVNGNHVEAENGTQTKSLPGYSLEYDAARKIAQGLGAHLEKLSNLVEIKGDSAMLLSAGARTRYLFGKDAGAGPKERKKKSAQQKFEFMLEVENLEAKSGNWTGDLSGRPGLTVLDQLHQSMILFGAGRGEAMKRFLVEEGVGRNSLFWRLAQALSALYPAGTDEKRWVDGVLARKKGLGF